MFFIHTDTLIHTDALIHTDVLIHTELLVHTNEFIHMDVLVHADGLIHMGVPPTSKGIPRFAQICILTRTIYITNLVGKVCVHGPS